MTLKNSSIYDTINKNRKTSETDDNINTRYSYTLPAFSTNIYKFSFTRLSINYLNTFLINFQNQNKRNFLNNKPIISIKTYFSKNFKSLLYKLSNFIT